MSKNLFPGARCERSGDDRARTGNLRLAKPALSQLSYVPIRTPASGKGRYACPGGLWWIRTTGLVLIRDAL